MYTFYTNKAMICYQHNVYNSVGKLL